MLRKNIIPLVGLLCVAASSQTAAFQISPGYWKVQYELLNSMVPQPYRETLHECVDKQFDPIQEMAKEGTCTVLDKTETDDTLIWKVSCTMEPGTPPLQGSGKFVKKGNKAHGTMKMKMSLQGFNVEMTSNWTGERVSDKCK